MVETRKLAGRDIYPIGFGAMNVSHCYQPRLPDNEGGRVLLAALDLGYTHFDTAAVYGHGHNEALIGEYLSPRRDEIVLTSKCGIVKDPDTGKRGINNRTDLIRQSIDETLSLLKTDHLDIFYLHRWDKVTPIEEVVGEMGRLVEAGKVRTLGLSEVSAKTLRKAHATHPISAVQSEYSLWTRNPEIAVLEACREIGATFVAFSPVARQFLTGKLTAVDGFVMMTFAIQCRGSNLRFMQKTSNSSLSIKRLPTKRAAHRRNWLWLGCSLAESMLCQFLGHKASPTRKRTFIPRRWSYLPRSW